MMVHLLPYGVAEESVFHSLERHAEVPVHEPPAADFGADASPALFSLNIFGRFYYKMAKGEVY